MPGYRLNRFFTISLCLLLLLLPFGESIPTLSKISAQTETKRYRNHIPVWSPDGERIAFLSNRGGSHDLWIMDPDGSNLFRVIEVSSTTPLWAPEPVWSPDGQQIAFSSDRSGNYDVWVVSKDDAHSLNLTADNELPDWSPAWSPDGKRIAFVSARTGNPNIWIADTDGSRLGNLTHRIDGMHFSPQWSPDGTKIAFVSEYKDSSSDVWVIDVDGANPGNLTENYQ